uniref:Phytanoyl-CoA dioxygenase n=1 Tax=Trichuris muris TaxID=70415 RepID=A0A5S6QYD8_TRIMR
MRRDFGNWQVQGAISDDQQALSTALVVPYSAVRQLEHTLTGNDFVISKTWRGEPVTEHEPFNFHLEWYFQRVRGKPHKRVVKVYIDGPLFDDPPEPDNLGGHCPTIYDQECISVVFANNRSQYLDIAVGPHGHWLVRMFSGKGREITKEELELEVQNVFEGNDWRSVFEIPLAYFPGAVTRYNAFALHGSGSRRHVEAFQPISDGRIGDVAPELHRIEFYKPIKIDRLIPDGFNDHSFNDVLYGNLWDD